MSAEITLRGDGPAAAGVIVLPTGAGKTETAARWLVREALASKPRTRVLWIAHQRELLQQALSAFGRAMAEMPPGQTIRSRVFHSDADPTTLLADPDIDLALVTNATLGRQIDAAKRQRLLAFLAEPTVIVIDEAHHAGASSYQNILEVGRAAGTVRGVIGLTATPWPTGARGAAAFRSTFPRRFIELSQESLIGDGILARPTLHTVATGQIIRLTREELVESQRRDDLGSLGAATRRHREPEPTGGQAVVGPQRPLQQDIGVRRRSPTR